MTDPTESKASSQKTGTKVPKRSIEVEYWVIDEDGKLTSPGPLVDAAPGVEREFVEPLLEIKTSPCETVGQLRRQLYDRLGRVLTVADSEGMGLVPLATPLHASRIEDLPQERTRIQDRVLGDAFECVRNCAGTHLHFEQIPGRETDQFNLLTAVDPALALVNSAPYFQGSRLAAGARSEIYRWKAYETLPHQGELWPYVESTAEWGTRLQRRYDEFVAEAVIAGCERKAVESCFDPESAVWTPVKLREEFSTVEWRSPDTALPSHVLELAEQLSALVRQLSDKEIRIEGTTGRVTDDTIVLPRFDVVREHTKVAVRTGLSSNDLRSYLDRMGFDLSTFTPTTTEFDGEDLSREQARKLRLQYAARLENDVADHGTLVAEGDVR